MSGSEDKHSKTEAPSKRKLQKARESGQVARSQDLSSAAALTTMIVVSAFMFPYIGNNLRLLFIHWMRDFPTDELSPDGIQTIIIFTAKSFLFTVLPLLLIIWCVAFATTLMQVGFNVSLKPITPNLDKVNPINGFKRLASMRSIVTTSMSVLKMLAVTVIAGSVLYGNKEQIIASNLHNVWGILSICGSIAWEISIKAAGTLLLLALLDFAYQKWQFTEDQKMTKHEVREEHKEQEGNPMIKGQIKARQRAASQRRGLKESIQEADLIVTNPYHIAVALKYDRSVSAAPIVVAKGARLLAQRIREFAGDFNVEIVQNIPLARALYKDCRVDREIPPEFYVAVAEILSVVFAKRRGR